MSTDDMSTKPTIETVLDRINALGENLSRQIGSLREEFNTRIGALEGQVAEIHITLKTFSRKIDVLNNNVLQLQADQMDLHDRVEKLETKAS